MDNPGVIYGCLHILSSNAVDNPGVIYGCLHIYPVMPWTILGSSMVVYIYIQLCCGQCWDHLWLSTYISSKCCGQYWGHLWLSTYISSNAVDNPGFIYGCLHIYPVMLWSNLGSSMVVYTIYPVMLWTILGSSMVVYIYIQ